MLGDGHVFPARALFAQAARTILSLKKVQNIQYSLHFVTPLETLRLSTWPQNDHENVGKHRTNVQVPLVGKLH